MYYLSTRQVKWEVASYQLLHSAEAARGCCIDMLSSETSMSSGNGTPSCHVTMEMQICATQGWTPESHKPAHVYEKEIFCWHQG